MASQLQLHSQKGKTNNLSHGMPLAMATPTLQAMVSPSAQAALEPQTAAEFLAKSAVLKLAPIELAGANYGKDASPSCGFHT